MQARILEAQLAAQDEERRRRRQREEEEEAKNQPYTSMFRNAFFGMTKSERGTYKEYIAKHKIEFEEHRERPICMLEFEKMDQVKGLKCSDMHIYHKECINNMIERGERKCALCR